MEAKAGQDNRSLPEAADLLARVRVVLINTTHPGNIGATARAMKVMGLSSLHLVSPKLFPNADATARASGAADELPPSTKACDKDHSSEAGLDGTSHLVARLARPLLIRRLN